MRKRDAAWRGYACLASAAAAVAVAVALWSAPVVGAKAEVAKLRPYTGAGTWVDLYEPGALRNPTAVVHNMDAQGVRTLFLETANYSTPSWTDVAYPLAASSFVEAAHARGIRVVAWYLPSFLRPATELRRALGTVRFQTPLGDRFDSFALDIEANKIRSIPRRNRAAVRLSRRIRAAVGGGYPLAAIVPDQRSTTVGLPGLWPRFPYRRLAGVFDAFLPMSYSSFRGRGPSYVYRYTMSNVAYLRAKAGAPGLPVHVIGGLANRLGPREDRAVVRAAHDSGALGASFYSFTISGTGEWNALRAFNPSRILP